MAAIAFVEKSQGEYWDRLNAGIFHTSRQRGDEARIYAPATVNPTVQLQYIYQALNDGADALVIVASDSNMFAEAVKSALDRGVPVLTMDLDGYTEQRLFHFGTLPYYQLGRLAAEEMLARIRKEGPVIAQSGSDAPGSCGKLQGFCDRMKQADRDIILIEPDYENPLLAREKVQNVLENNKNTAGLYGVYAYHCNVQAQAVERCGLQPGSLPIVGFDMLDETINRLKDGSVAASIWIDEYDFGASAAMAAGLFACHPWEEVVKFLGGTMEDRSQNVRTLPISFFTKNNVQAYEEWFEAHR